MAYRPRLAAAGRPTTRSPPGPWARSRCWSSTRRRCCARAACWSPGRARATPPRRPRAPPRPNRWAWLSGDVLPVKPFPASENRHLHVVRKISPTPAGFPRRPGMARKRPLGSPPTLARAHKGTTRSPPNAFPTGPDRTFRPRWAPFSQSQIRRAGWARPPPRSTSAPASRTPATPRCWSTSIRSATLRLHLGCRRTVGPASTTASRGPHARPPRRSRAASTASTSCPPRPTSPAPTSSCRASPARRRSCATASASVRDRYLFTLLDCPPSLGPLTVNALVAADRVIVPVQTEYFALEGLAQLLDTLSLIQRELNPRLTVAGMILTMHDGRTRLARDVEREVREHFPAARLRHGHPAQRPARRGAELRRPGPPARAAQRRQRGVPEAGQGGGGSWLSAASGASGMGRRASRRSCRAARQGEDGLREIPLELIEPNPRQPRRTFDEAELAELAESIRDARRAPADRGAAARRRPLRAGRGRAPAARGADRGARADPGASCATPRTGSGSTSRSPRTWRA